jgi:hypothetical protein
MKILKITAEGLPLFKEKIEVNFYATKRVCEVDKLNLFQLCDNPSIYLNNTAVFIGINASGKTSVLKTIELAIRILNNDPINYIAVRNILQDTEKARFEITFADQNQNICMLQTDITSKKSMNGDIVYSIENEKLWKKPIVSVKSKKALTDFSNIDPVSIRNADEAYLPEDVSFIIASNKQNKDFLNMHSLISFTNINVLPFIENIPSEILGFLDPTIEYLSFQKIKFITFIYLKFYGKKEMILNNAEDLEQYLSSGTIKGIVVFSMVKETLRTGGYLLVDEIENCFNKEIVATLIRFFMDTRLNKKGGTLIYATHDPELLDEYSRNDAIYFTRNKGGITVDNLSTLLNRNDIKKSEIYQSNYIQGTAPSYKTYIQLINSLKTVQ